MAEFQGSVRFPFPRSTLGEKLSDAAFLASCVHGAEHVRHSADEAHWQSVLPFSFATGKITTILQIHDRRAESFQLRMRHQLGGSNITLNGTMHVFEETDGLCRIDWSAQIVSRTGLIKIVPVGVLKSQVEQSLRDLWDTLQKKLATAGQLPG